MDRSQQENFIFWQITLIKIGFLIKLFLFSPQINRYTRKVLSFLTHLLLFGLSQENISCQEVRNLNY